MNTESEFNSEARTRSKRLRFNPLGNLEPTSLARHLDAFNAGRLAEAATIWELIEQRDDLIRTVVSKRKKSVAREGFTVVLNEEVTDSTRDEAREHAAALEFFYRNLECENAIDSSEKGGFKLLVRQMMDAVGKRFAVHEIIWRKVEGVVAEGGNREVRLAATFRFVLLNFFENTTGELRFLENESMQTGRALKPGAWMVTAGEGLMAATSTAWVLKNMSLGNWMIFAERNGRPMLRAISSAEPNSPEWDELRATVEDVIMGKPVIHGASDDIKVIDLAAGGEIPFPQLVERMDRMIAAIWRGADLSTLSRDRGYGASLQEKETCALEEDDAEMLTETLNRYVDRWVIHYLFGAETKPLARVKILSSGRECTPTDLQIDEFLLKHGAPLSVESVLNRYGRVLPKAGERIFLGGSMPGESAAGEIKASRSESSHNLGMAEGMGNNHWGGSGVTVSPRSCLQPISLTGVASEVAQNCAGADDAMAEAGSPASAAAPFTLTDQEWVQLSPYGDFPHTRGLQRVNRAAAELMTAQFNTFGAKLGRLFGGIPFFVGHPDMPGTHELIDRKAYGWIVQLEAREDAFYGRVKWSEAGFELLRNAHYKFLSPYWEAREVGRENGQKVFQPISLISVGLTNAPNLPVKPLANAISEGMDAASCENEDSPALPLTGCAQSGVERCDFSGMHTTAITAGLGMRKPEIARMQNRRDLIHECVLQKTKLGLSYDEAWENVKREHWAWFESK